MSSHRLILKGMAMQLHKQVNSGEEFLGIK